MTERQTFFYPLPAEEVERLALLAEECSEVIHIINKILRHGYESYHPAFPNLDNRGMLEKECGHVRHAMLRACAAGDITKAHIHRWAEVKMEEVEQYLHYQPKWEDYPNA